LHIDRLSIGARASVIPAKAGIQVIDLLIDSGEK
jgi:hypothetical protein